MKTPTPLLLDRVPTPTGTMLLVADDQGRLRALDWGTHEARMLRLLRLRLRDGFTLVPTEDPFGLSTKLKAWFDGDLSAFDGVEVETGGTAFQRQVWSALREIPVAETRSYGGLAQRIGRPTSVRAVGLANGANAVALVIPCHRVIGANASMTGYGGGVDRKRWLLDHEQAHAVR